MAPTESEAYGGGYFELFVRLKQTGDGRGVGKATHKQWSSDSQCVFGTDSTTHSGRIRPLITDEIDHRLRG